MDGYLSTEMILHTLGKIYEKLKEKGCDFKKYKIMIELKNIKNLYLYFPTLNKEWFNIFMNRFRISLKDNVKIEVPYSIGRSENVIVAIFSILAIGFASVFGFSILEYTKLYELAAKAKERFLPISSYSNAEYNENLEKFFEELL